MKKLCLLLTLLALFTVTGIGDVRAAPRDVRHAPGQEGTCASYGITFTDDSVQTLYTSPGTVLAAPEAFWETDTAYRILSTRYRSSSPSSGLNKWKGKLYKIDRLPPEKRAMQEPARFARELMSDQEALCAAVAPHVLSYLPEGTDLKDTTIYLTALEHPFTGATHKTHIMLFLSHPMYLQAELLFDRGSSSVKNVLAHELVHRGYGETRALRTEHSWEDSPLQDLIEAVHEEGMATYVASELRTLYPSPRDPVYLRLDSELWVRMLIARLNRLLARADTMDPARLSTKVYRFCIKQQSSYVVGAYMARTIEARLGKEALVATVAQSPAAFIRAYNSVAKGGMSVAYQPPPIPKGSLYLELRDAALAKDAAAAETGLSTIEARTTFTPSEYEVYMLFRTGELLLRQGRLEQATRAFQHVIAARPELAAGHLGLGECYQAAGQGDLARAAYDEGLELDPRAAWAAIALQELE